MRLKIIALGELTQWRGAAEKIRLPVDEVHIWSADLRVGRAVLCTCWDLLSPEETRVALGYRFAKDRREFVVTRALLRQILAQYVGQTPAELCIESDGGGKPVLRGTLSLYFNVSHSEDVSFIVVARHQVGIDVEYIRTDAPRQTGIEQCLSPRELSYLNGLPVSARAMALYHYWTGKEAVLKAHGVGLRHPPLLVKVFAGGRKPHVVRALGRKWLLRQVAAPDGYAAAVAIERPN